MTASSDHPQLWLYSLAGVNNLENPQVQCPHCDEVAPLRKGFSRIEMDPVLECNRCHTKVSDRHLQEILMTHAAIDSLHKPDEWRLMCAYAFYIQQGDKVKELVGTWIDTWPMGSYNGGEAKIIEVDPDPQAPEILFTIENPLFTDDDGGHTIGVFRHELVQLVRNAQPQT